MSDILNKLQALIGKTSTESTTDSSGNKNAGGSSSTSSSYNEVSVFTDKADVMPNSSTQIEDEEYFWWQERLEEKKAAEEQAELGYDTHDVEPQTGEEKSVESRLKITNETKKEDDFDINNLNPEEWNSVSPVEDKSLGLFKNGNYTYKTSNGIEISLEDIKDVKILENKQTGEVVVIGANGAKITGGGENAILSIYDSYIDEINTGKGSDNIKITSSKVNEINTGNGTDSIVITGDSHVKKMNTGAGSDSVSIIDSNVTDTNTSSKFMWGLFDDKEDTIIIDSSYAGKINTGKGNDNVIVSNSAVDTIKSGKGDDNLSINDTKIKELNTNETDKIVEDGNYVDIDIQKISDIDALDSVTLPDGSSLKLDDYIDSLLNQPTSFETEEEYQAYVIETLTSNLETMRNVFGAQEDNDGLVADGYNALKELTGLGISDKDVESMIADQEAMIKALTDAMNGQGNMSFEEAYELYTGTSYSKEKLDNYLETSNVYSAMMVGLQYDPDYLEKFEAATGKTVEDVTKEYAMCQLDTFGKSTGLQDLVEKYSQDQEGFAEKLSSTITSLGFGCTIAGAVLSFVFPPAGLALLTAGKYATLGGMFIDNAIDIVDDSTDKNGLTKEELKENALETGVEIISYGSGRLIGGLTGNINSNVASNILEKGGSEVISKIVGQAAETSTDMLLSLGADYLITQGESFISTGEFVAWDDYWSLDRFLGEGKSQLIGILTGISSSKVSAYQQGVMATAGAKINAGDIDGAKTYLKNSGMKMNDTNFEQFVKTVQDANVEIVPKQPLTENENTEPPVSKGGNNETELPILKDENLEPEQPKQNTGNSDAEVIKPETDTKTPNTEPLKESGSDVEVDKPIETEISTTNQLNIEQLKTLTKEEQIQALKSNGVSDFKIEQLMELGSEAVAKVISLTNKGTNIYNAKNIAELGDIEYQRAIELIDKYYLGSDGSVNLKEIVSLNNDAYSKVPELLASNCHTDCIAKIASLYDPTYPDDYETAIKLLNDGYDSFSIENCIDDCGFIDTSKLTNTDLIKQPRNIDIDYSNMDTRTKQILVDKINTLYKSDVVSIDSDISSIAQKWKSKYIDGGANPLSLDNQTNNFMIENSCQKYENPTGEPMARWMEISNLSYFINNFPANGEIYTFDRMQSFAKTEAGAETIRGNNFSDTNTSKNVKILVIPNEKTTQAYDVGNGKYGSDEVLYKAGTQFKVVSQGFEEIKLPSGEVNKQYIIKLEEIPQKDVIGEVYSKMDIDAGKATNKNGAQYFNQKPVDNDVLETQTQKIEIPERTSKYQDLSIEEKRQLVKNTIQDPNLANKFSSYSDEKITQVLDLKDMGLSEHEILWSVNKNLNQQQFNTLTHLLESGYSQDSAIDLAKVDPNKLDTAIELTNKGLRTNLLDKVLNLESSEYSRATELLDLGIKDSSIMKYVKLDDSSYSKVTDLLKVGLSDITDRYEIQRRLNLSDSEFEAELQKLKQIEAMREDSNIPAEIKPIELSSDEIQELVTYLNKHGQTCSVDDNIKDLEWKWEQVYRSSGYTPNVLNPKIEDAMIVKNKRYTMPDVQIEGHSTSSLNRWMLIDDMDSFIGSLPDVGGVYSPNRIQSFSTIKHSAETSFSDFNPNNNVKLVVLPANKTTSAFQIENKYNSGCEVIYPSTTQFRVLYKGIEEYPGDFDCDPAKGSHQMYTVYLQEVIPDDVSQKFSDAEIPDVAVNKNLSSNAVALNQTFKEHIAEVKAETKERFSGLETVKDENITARAKGDDSTFSKLASKFKNGKLNSTDIDACSNAIGDAYGTRIQMNSVDSTVAETEITKTLDGTGITYEQFVNHITGKVKYDDATKQKIDEIKTPVLDILKTQQSQEVVSRLVSLINDANPNDPPVITELNNYGGNISSYFTDAQLEQIATAYSEKYDKPLDIVTKLDETNLPSGKLEVTRKDGKKILNVESSKAKYTDKGATKDSGYTSSQMNTKHKLADGTVGNGELQIRGTEVNAFADVEHIPYDIKQGKVDPDNPIYSSIYKLIDEMSESTYKSYNEYLTAVYDTLRLKELGIPVDGEPDIKTYLKDSGLSDDDLTLLSREGLEKLH